VPPDDFQGIEALKGRSFLSEIVPKTTTQPLPFQGLKKAFILTIF
jgi:hypothetical protein